MTEGEKWDEHYKTGNAPWETNRSSPELQQVVGELKLKPCRALEVGCGTGTSSVWLARQGFEVTGLDISNEAIKIARKRAQDAGLNIAFIVADVLNPPSFNQPFEFFFDRGCYHAVRRTDPLAYGAAVAPLLAPGSYGLILAGNAKETHEVGPPTVSEQELRDELTPFFEIVQLREFRFDPKRGTNENFLAWSCLLKVK